jgi:hypothetical protein
MLPISRRERTDTRRSRLCNTIRLCFEKEPVMKSLVKVAVLTSMLASFSAFAHHPAEDIIDEDVWAMVDENVSDTPHADLDLSDMGM